MYPQLKWRKKTIFLKPLSEATYNGVIYGFRAGLTALYTQFDRPLSPKTSQTYRVDYPAGYDFLEY